MPAGGHMPVIGIAEFLVRPSFAGAQRAVGRELDGIANTEGSRAGSSMGRALGGALKIGAVAAGGAVIGGLGLALTKGFGRLQAIENAKAKLVGLGHTADTVTTIMGNAGDSVKGTAFGLGEAATVAANAVAAGVKPGKDLQRTLTLVGDAATIAGTDMGAMGAIFNKAAASNKVQMDVINQLHDAGVPALALLAEQMGVTAEEASKMASDGKIDFETFQAAMEKGLGGAAQESGKTLEGAFKNTIAAVGRIGANLLDGVYPKIQEFFSGAIGWLKPLEESAKVAGAAVGDFLNEGLSAAKGITDILFKGDFTGGIFGLEEDSGFVDFLFNARDAVIGLASYIKTDLIPMLQGFGGWVVKNKDWLLSLAVGVGAMVLAFKLWTGAVKLWQAVTKIAMAVQVAFNAVMAANPIGLIVLAIVGLVAGLTYFFTQTETGKKIVEVAFAAIQSAISAVVDWWNGTLVPALQAVGQWFKDVWDGAAGAVQTAVQWIQDAIGNVIGWISNNWGLLLTIILGPLGFIIQWVVKNWTQISDTVKAVFDAVAAAFTWVYESIIKPVFDSIMVIVNGFYLFFRGIFQLVVSIFVNILAPAFMNFWHGIVEPVFAAIGILVGMWWTTVSGIFTSVVTFIQDVLGAVFTWFRDSVITPVFGFISDAIGLWWAIVSGVFTTAVSFIQTVFSAVFTWLRDSVIMPVFNGIRDGITLWWTGVSFIFNTVVSFIRNTLAAAFTWLRDNVINPVWNGIKDTISNVWNNGIKPVFDFLANAIQKDVPNAFQKGVDGVKSIWETLLDIAKAPVRFVVNTVINDGLIGAFNTVAGILPGIDKLARVALPAGFADGGWTGPGGMYDPAGVVHADEFVVKKSSRRSIEGRAPGFLDALNSFGASALSKLGYANGGRVNPVKNMALTQGFSAYHDGIDIGVGVGTPVFAAGAGRIVHAGPGATAPGVSGGNEVHLLSDGVEQWYAHLSQVGVKLGQMVAAGQQIALSGNTGISSGPHLHFGTYKGGWPNAMNPLSYLGGAESPKGGGGFNPLGAITGLADKIVGQIKGAFPMGGFMIDAVTGIGQKLIGSVVDWAKGKLGMGAATGPANGAHLNPLLYDEGGILRPGISQVINRTRQPEAILNPQQWASIHHLATQRGNGLDTAALDRLTDAVKNARQIIIPNMSTDNARALALAKQLEGVG